ncbi:hypothetical protein LXL04_004759 [Taraxacum kok-saghyz]
MDQNDQGLSINCCKTIKNEAVGDYSSNAELQGSDESFDTPTTSFNASTNPPQYTIDYCCEPCRKSVLIH